MAKVVCRRTRFRKNNYPIREVYLSQNFHTTLHIVRQTIIYFLSRCFYALGLYVKKTGKNCHKKQSKASKVSKIEPRLFR